MSEYEDARIALIGWLVSHERLSQKAVADVLRDMGEKGSRSGVNKLFKKAVKRGWVKTTSTFDRKKVGSKIFNRASEMLSGRKLKEELNNAGVGIGIDQIRVFDSGSRGTTEGAWEKRAATMAKSAAGFVSDHLLKSKSTGVGWGRTVAALVQELAARWKEGPRAKKEVGFLPIAGEMIGHEPGPISSTRLAGLLHESLNPSKAKFWSLAGIPALIPRKFDEVQAATIREFIEESEGYATIFNQTSDGAEPLINQVDAIVTSVGQPGSILTQEMLQGSGSSFDAAEKELGQLFSCDLCGVFVKRDGLSKEQNAAADSWISRWTGYQREHLEKCAEKRRPGVLLLAFGKDKSASVLSAITQVPPIVNALAIDRDLFTELKRLLKVRGT